MDIVFYDQFWHDSADPRSRVQGVLPRVFRDGRGFFSEVMRHIDCPPAAEWLSNLSWVKQVNRSLSSGGVIRGMHAQRGRSCQGKLVQAALGRVVDVITDARPNSETFGVSDAFVLDSETQNQLWVPRGFLHGFAVPSDCGQAVFEYFCDNVYDRDAEIGIRPDRLVAETLRLKKLADPSFPAFQFDGLNLSEKDKAGADYEEWMAAAQRDYNLEGKLWYR